MEKELIDYSYEILNACQFFIPGGIGKCDIIEKFLEAQLYYVMDRETQELYIIRKNKDNIIIWKDSYIYN